MLKRIVLSLIAIVVSSAVTCAGDRFYFPGHVFAAPPVVVATPVVAYQPAYFVPTPVVTVQTYPVATVSYSTHYYAPLVPTVANYYSVRPAPVYAAPVVVAPVSYVRTGHFGRRHSRGFRGVEIEIERDGDIEIDYK